MKKSRAAGGRGYRVELFASHTLTRPPIPGLPNLNSRRSCTSTQEVDGRPIRVNVSVARGDARRPLPEQLLRLWPARFRRAFPGAWITRPLRPLLRVWQRGRLQAHPDRETGRSRGSGPHVHPDEADAVVAGLNGQDVDGRILRDNIANVDK